MSLLISLLSPPGGGGGGDVTSVFSRTGNVVATSGDYNASQITSSPFTGISATNVQAALSQIYSAIPDVSGFVPYTGASGNVNLGTHNLLAANATLSSLTSASTSFNINLPNILTGHGSQVSIMQNATSIFQIESDFNTLNSETIQSLQTLNDGTGSSIQIIASTPSYFLGNLGFYLNSDHSGIAKINIFDAAQVSHETVNFRSSLTTFLTNTNFATLTANELVATDGTKNLQSLTTSTYPSLTELSYVKGVSSSIQDQINAIAGGGSSTYVIEAPGGIINGSNTSFTISYSPLSNTQSIYVNGVFQSLVDDYTLSGMTITFVVAPIAGDNIKVSYQYGTSGPSTYAIEVLSGVINGSNTTFTITHTPLLNTQSLYVNGIYQSEISDYALSGSTITFIAAPQVSDKLTITYQY